MFHGPLLDSDPGIDLVAVVTGDASRRAAVARDHPRAVCVGSLAELVPLGVQAVTISTPPSSHAPLALQAFRLGLHVVVDKPFARTEPEAITLCDAAAAAGVLLVPYQNRRWDDDFRTVAALIASGRLGTVWRFESRIERSRPVKSGWPSDVSAGGGVLLDLGPHLVDQALLLLGPAVAVRADVRVVREGATADDYVMLDVFHLSGAHSTVTASLATPAAGPRLLVQGSRAGVRIEGFDVQEAQLKAGATPRSLGRAWGVDPERTAVVVEADHADGATTAQIPLERGRWDAFYPGVAAAITKGEPVPVPNADAVAIARVLDAARTSARIGASVPIERPAPSG